jgi:hypothetical protein
MPTYSRGSPYPAADSTPGRHNHEVGIVGVMPTSAQPDCADLVIVPMSFLDAPAEQGLQAGEVGTIRETHPRPYSTEVRRTHGRPEGDPHPCQRFTPIPPPKIG